MTRETSGTSQKVSAGVYNDGDVAGAGQAEDQELLIATHSPLICKFILLLNVNKMLYLFYHLLSTLGVEIETFYVFLIISF